MTVDAWDLRIVGLAAGSFVVFFTLHLIGARLTKTEVVFKWLINTFLAATAVHIVLAWFVVRDIPGTGDGVLAALLAYLIFGMMAFFYILCIFGPYESSIRIRIIRELRRVHPKGLSWEELLRIYNGEVLLKNRLKRLLGNHDVLCTDGRYTLNKTHNMFFFLDGIAGLIRRLTEGKRS